MRSPLVIAALLSILSVQAQNLPILDQNPPSLPWYQLKTPHFRVIYPRGLEQPAHRTAQRLEEVYEPVSAGLARRPRPVPIILQNQTSVSNGFATLFPRRSEFFTAPPQDPTLLGTLNWLDLLAVHEYRHIVQYEKALQGYGKVLHTLLGAQGLAFAAQVVTPGWFLEGDAVGTETILTNSGRGRIPAFELATRTNLLTRPAFSFAKATGGSFRDVVPNHYELGYFMTTKLKRTYGPDAWSRALNQIYTQFPLYPFSFSNGLKKSTKSPGNRKGTRVDDLYAETTAELTETWQQRQKSLILTPATRYPVLVEKASTEPSARSRPVFTNYRYPQYLSDSTVLCVKSGLGDIQQLVLLRRNGTEKRVFTQGLVLESPDMLSATPQLACWIENRFDPRWGQQIFAEIVRLDLATGRHTRLTHRSRYKAVAISPDNSQLIAVRNETDDQCRLVVLDARNGRELSVLPNPSNDLYIQPRWFDTQTIVTVTLSGRGKTIELINTVSGQKRALLPISSVNLSHPQPYTNAFVLYNSPQTGIDNIYAVNVATGQTSQVTSRPFGAYHVSVSPGGARGQWLAFQDYDTHGFRIGEMPLDPAEWPPVGKPGNVPDQTTRYFGPLLTGNNQLINPIKTDSVAPSPVVQTGRYRRLAHPFNLYGWGPAFTSDGQGLTIGIQSQDLLGTTQLSAGYTYNQSEQVGGFAANMSYQGLYPVLDIGVQTGNRRTSFFDRGNVFRTDTWRYNQVTAGIRLPFQFTRSRFNQVANLSAFYGYQQVSGYDLPGRFLTETGNGSLHTLTYGGNYTLALRQSRRDVGPRLGVALSSQVRHSPFAGPGQLMGAQWGSSAVMFLPGIGKHHALRLRGAYQYQWGTPDANRLYRFQASVLYPRGAPYVAADELLIGGAEYRLPLADLHLSLTRLLYIQRIKGGVFTDYAHGNTRNLVVNNRGVATGIVPTSHYDWTVGSDLSFVFNPLRLRTPLELGVRATYSVRTGQYLIQPLILDIGF